MAAMERCPATTKAGKRCPNNGHLDDLHLCHVHRGSRRAQQEALAQAEHLVRAVAVLAQQEAARQAAYLKVRCVAQTPKGVQCSNMIRAGYGTDVCAAHGGGRQGKRLLAKAR